MINNRFFFTFFMLGFSNASTNNKRQTAATDMIPVFDVDKMIQTKKIPHSNLFLKSSAYIIK